MFDVASLMTKGAATTTAGVLGDPLALNTQQVTGANAPRELPVAWAVAKGCLRIKAILVTSAETPVSSRSALPPVTCWA
ncbi:DUF808 family protein, partial [Pseudomonas aeruginosa]